MNKLQRSSLAVLIISATLFATTGSTTSWVIMAIGYIGFVADDLPKLVLRAFFTAIWCAGWLYRRITFQREPTRPAPE